MNKHIIDLISQTQGGDDQLLNEFVKLSAANPNTLWYPSAGLDFRTILECGTARRSAYDFPAPGIYIHSDHSLPDRLKRSASVLHEDGRTSVRVLERSGIMRIASYPARLMLLQVDSHLFGQVIAPLIYVHADNRDFFNNVLIANKVDISHFVKVREGCTYHDRSINGELGRISQIGIRYALLDHQTAIVQLNAKRTADPFFWSYGQARADSSAMIVTPYHVSVAD